MWEHDEAGTLAALKVRRRDVLAPVVAQHNGRVVKLMGDGVLVEFGSAVDAVQCAEAEKCLQRAEVAEAKRVKLRWLVLAEAWLKLSESLKESRLADEPFPFGGALYGTSPFYGNMRSGHGQEIM
jgi:hypothetical protein